jgi:hypothetical protein
MPDNGAPQLVYVNRDEEEEDNQEGGEDPPVPVVVAPFAIPPRYTTVVYHGYVAAVLFIFVVCGIGLMEFGIRNPDHPMAFVYHAVTRRGASFDREDIIECMLYYVDGLRQTKDSRGRNVYVLNPSSRDGCVDEEEIDLAKFAYLSPFERKVSWVQPNSKIMANCDFDVAEEDKNGRPHCISREDMVRSNKTCLNTPDKLEKMETYICRRARSKFKD